MHLVKREAYLVLRNTAANRTNLLCFALIFSFQGIQLYVGFGELLRGSNNEKNYALFDARENITSFLRMKLKNEKSLCLAAAFSLIPRQLAMRN